MKTSNWLILTVAAGLLAGGVVAYKAEAVERPTAERGSRGKFFERAKEKLGLTDEQAGKIKSELKAEKDTLKSIASRLHEARMALREAIQAPDANETSVRAASAKVAAVEADLAVERLKLHSRISPILSAEQREKVAEFQARIDDFVDTLITRLGDRLSE